MKFKFRDVPVEVKDGKVKCDDEYVRVLLSPVVRYAQPVSPAEGDPVIVAITKIYGTHAVTDIEADEDEEDLIN